MERGRLTFKDLATLEPRLAQLYIEAKQQEQHFPKHTQQWTRDRVWYRDFKPRMIWLVGFMVKEEGILQSSEAYDLAYKTISEALDGERTVKRIGKPRIVVDQHAVLSPRRIV
jgi:hypothetical protein